MVNKQYKMVQNDYEKTLNEYSDAEEASNEENSNFYPKIKNSNLHRSRFLPFFCVIKIRCTSCDSLERVKWPILLFVLRKWN